MKISIVLSTVRLFEDLLPAFNVSSNSAEMIIIDSKWNRRTKEKLEKLNHNYARVVYAPPRPRFVEEQQKHDMMNAQNTGLAYTENDWVFSMGDNWEFKPDFFDVLEEDINRFSKVYGNKFAIRPLELEPWNNDTKWNSYISYSDRYFYLPCQPLGKTGLRKTLSIITSGLSVTHIDTIELFNGWDERYDCGCGWSDNDMFERIVALKYPFIFDQQLMTYRLPHKQIVDSEGRKPAGNMFLEKIQAEIQRGELRCPNPFDFKELHKEMLEEKEKYII
jgi:hypothetical protein